MAAIFAFKCDRCGKTHEGAPSFAYMAPDEYASLSDEQKSEIASLADDSCTIAYPGETHYFVRSILEIPIHGTEEPFSLGLWVSVSEKSFVRYTTEPHATIEGEGFFGWVCNEISIYPYKQPRPTDVVLQPKGYRPKLVLHRGSPEDDPLVIDQASGISVDRAQELAELALHGG
ncbi:DUF2199 domain-containing protein [Caldimonas sp. KR1-144]|uniref:DUF2199 domain-containing protein n=1 Tax=Caldimonas sp. KR1-144 TaxID=3400911 RepID=UPI003C11A40D